MATAHLASRRPPSALSRTSTSARWCLEVSLSPGPQAPPAGGLREHGWRSRLSRIIYETDTFAGLAFDVVLMVAIAVSVLLVALETVASIESEWHTALLVAEWVFTALFTIEYGLRLIVAERPLRYARSFFGVIDLLSVLPTLISPVLPGAQHLLILRSLRLLRIFRVLKLAHFSSEAQVMLESLKRSGRKIVVFYLFVAVLVIVFGTLMFVLEGPEHGFDSIPASIYWAVVTVTTVGFGDITPKTVPGRMFASFIMLTGYAIIAVPTGIVTVEFSRAGQQRRRLRCVGCGHEDHLPDAAFCGHCGAKLG